MTDRLDALHEGEPPGGLTFWEATMWRSMYHTLEDHGYRLRDRYCPGWEPSWIAKGLEIATVRERHLESEFEDAIPVSYI